MISPSPEKTLNIEQSQNKYIVISCFKAVAYIGYKIRTQSKGYGLK